MFHFIDLLQTCDSKQSFTRFGLGGRVETQQCGPEPMEPQGRNRSWPHANISGEFRGENLARLRAGPELGKGFAIFGRSDRCHSVCVSIGEFSGLGFWQFTVEGGFNGCCFQMFLKYFD